MFDIILSIFSSFSKENQILLCAKLLSLVPLKTICIILHISLNSLRPILKGKKKKKRGRKTLDITEKILQIFKSEDYGFAYWWQYCIFKTQIDSLSLIIFVKGSAKKLSREIAKFIIFPLGSGKIPRFLVNSLEIKFLGKTVKE